MPAPALTWLKCLGQKNSKSFSHYSYGQQRYLLWRMGDIVSDGNRKVSSSSHSFEAPACMLGLRHLHLVTASSEPSQHMCCMTESARAHGQLFVSDTKRCFGWFSSFAYKIALQCFVCTTCLHVIKIYHPNISTCNVAIRKEENEHQPKSIPASKSWLLVNS